MRNNTLKVLVCMMAAALLFPLAEGAAFAESLNPEGVNPHAEAPRQKISVERKLAAAEARKKRQTEIAARKATQPALTGEANQGASSAGSANDPIKSDK